MWRWVSVMNSTIGSMMPMAPAAEIDHRRRRGQALAQLLEEMARALEGVVAFLEVQPELIPFGGAVFFDACFRHAEGKDMHGDVLLALLQCRRRQLEDLGHHGIGHGKAAGRRATAMD